MENNHKPQQSENHCQSFGERASDKMAGLVGSWNFILAQTVVLLIWMVLNIVSWIEHWDPYPYIFLNLVVAFVSAYSAPIILMSQNRTEERDRRKMERDLATDRKAEREIEQIQKQLKRIEKKIGEIAGMHK